MGTAFDREHFPVLFEQLDWIAEQEELGLECTQGCEHPCEDYPACCQPKK
jgi:hypothetical protein